jgi:hypothetical protein
MASRREIEGGARLVTSWRHGGGGPAGVSGSGQPTMTCERQARAAWGAWKLKTGEVGR